jgi:hypothetical protein
VDNGVQAMADAHLSQALGQAKPGPLVKALPQWELASEPEALPDGAAQPGRINLERVAVWRLRVEGGWLYQERMTFSSLHSPTAQGKYSKRVSYGRGKPVFVPDVPRAPVFAGERTVGP